MKKMPPLMLCALLAACGGDPATGAAADGAGGAAASTSASQAPADALGASFQATLTGEFNGSVDGTSAASGARYGRYHLSLAGTTEAGELVIISLARADTASPGPGSYALGEDGDFDGNVEIGDDHRDFAIGGGELVISRASGDTLEGTLAFPAQERTGDPQAPTVEVEATFRTRPAG